MVIFLEVILEGGDIAGGIEGGAAGLEVGAAFLIELVEVPGGDTESDTEEAECGEEEGLEELEEVALAPVASGFVGEEGGGLVCFAEGVEGGAEGGCEAWADVIFRGVLGPGGEVKLGGGLEFFEEAREFATAAGEDAGEGGGLEFEVGVFEDPFLEEAGEFGFPAGEGFGEG
ncbi:MAG: hypothetical protein RI897_4503 [Verrucomicrobiota bacterium]